MNARRRRCRMYRAKTMATVVPRVQHNRKKPIFDGRLCVCVNLLSLSLTLSLSPRMCVCFFPSFPHASFSRTLVLHISSRHHPNHFSKPPPPPPSVFTTSRAPHLFHIYDICMLCTEISTAPSVYIYVCM